MENPSELRPEIDFHDWDEQIANLIREPAEILRIIVACKENGSTVGVRSAVLGKGLFITAVDDIILEEGETIVRFMPYDVTGFMLPKTKIAIGEIEAVCPLISEFKNPVLRNIDKDKSWFF